MSLKDQLQQDLRDAMRARDTRRKAALRMILTSIQLAEVEKDTLDDADVLQIIQKEIRRREEALSMMKDAGRDDLVGVEVTELDVLRTYLPEPLSIDELTRLVRDVIAEVDATSPRDMGKVMQAVMPQVRGRADGRTVNKIVRELLAA